MPTVSGDGTPSVRTIVRELRNKARRSDVMVVAAALTCYATFGLVPLLAIATRVAGGMFGAEHVVGTATALGRFVPGPLGLDTGIVAFTRTAVSASWWTVLLALLPVSLYAEGIVRSLERFSRSPQQHGRALRGRLLTPVLTLLTVAGIVLLVGPVRPLLDGVGTGAGARLLGVLIAFNVLFFPVFAVLLVLYRAFASTPLRRGALLLAAFVAASWLCGQVLGYALAVRVLDRFDFAYGTYAPAGAVAAIAFLVYLEHLVFVLGYLLALVLHERADVSRSRPVRPRVVGDRTTPS